MKLFFVLPLLVLFSGAKADDDGGLIGGIVEEIPILGDVLADVIKEFGIDGAIEKFGCPALINKFGWEDVAEAVGIKCDKDGEGSEDPKPSEAPKKLTLEEKVINKTGYVTIAEVQGSRLYIWEDDTYTPSKFFVTPLGIININTLRCDPDYTDPSRHVFYFEVDVWNQDTKKIAEAALIEKGFAAETADILPLPMPEIKPGVNSDLISQIQVDNRWIKNENQPNTIAFQLYTEDKAFCDKLVLDAKTTPHSFLGRTKLYYEFRMSIGSPNKQKVIIWTVASDIPENNADPTVVCNESRIAELLDLINTVGTTDAIQKQAWMKELADLVAACKLKV